MTGEHQGTGKHPHKSTEEPFAHRGASAPGQQKERRVQHGESQAGSERRQSGSEGGGEANDLEQREYRDKDGNIHHHTRTSREYQEKQKG